MRRMMVDTLHSRRPLIAITSDLMVRNNRPTAFATMTYTQAVLKAGGIPVLLPPIPEAVSDLIDRFDGFILSGGDDPRTEPFGCPTHPCAIPIHDDRQAFETRLISELSDHPNIPLLGICLGMQMLALCRGGELNQHLPDTHTTHASHWEHHHEIHSQHQSRLPSGSVYSKHRQAVSDPGELRVVATAPDAVIEAIDDPNRPFTLGVQWHPERTKHNPLGQHIIDQLVNAARQTAAAG